MTAPTHIAFSMAVMLLCGCSSEEAILFSSIGAILPDIDHNKSFIGRILFFISIPINRRFGHRGITHSLILWGPVLLFSFLGSSYIFKAIFWVSLGAISHIVLDSWNRAGVQMCKPITEKIFVMANRNYRIRVASREEFVLMVFLVIAVFIGYRVSAEGGVRKIIRTVISDYQTTIKEYEKQGVKKCYFKGKIRFLNGFTEEGKWLVLGKNASENSISVYDEKRDKLIDIPKDGEFLKCDLEVTGEEWRTLKVDKMLLKSGELFYRADDGKPWKSAKSGEILNGYVLYAGEIELAQYKEPEKFEDILKKYEEEGVRICRIRGELRTITGVTEKGDWLIIGRNYGENSISVYDEKSKKIIEVPQGGEFLSAELVPTGKFWKIESTEGVAEVIKGEFFFRSARKFYRAVPGSVVAGEIFYPEGDKIEIKGSEL